MSLKKLGRYELVRVLGKGAMGMVYEGRDPNLDRRVAIKTIKVENLSPEEAAEYEVRFRTEARSAARLQHPNIVSVYDSDRDIDIAYLVMEFIQGEDLKHHLDHGKVYTLEQTVGIMEDLLAALQYAHQQSIVHRDVKPANLLLEASGRAKLTDFGVARIQDSGDATRTQGSMVGTLKYMSPEQVQGQAIDARTDLFAAGIVLYQLLTGKRPFDGTSDFDIIQQIVSKPHAPPSTLSPNLPMAIDAVVARALEKSRAERFSNAQEFALALREAAYQAEDRTVTPPPRSGPAGKSATWSRTVLANEALSGTSPSKSSTISTSPSTVTQEVELVYWKDIKESDDVQDFEEFLGKFPAGIYADLARRRLKKLLALAGDASSAGSLSGTRTMLVSADKPVASPVPGLDEPTMLQPKAPQPVVAPEPEQAPVPATEEAVMEPAKEEPVAAVPPPAMREDSSDVRSSTVPSGTLPGSAHPVEEAPANGESGKGLKWAVAAAVVLLLAGGIVYQRSGGPAGEASIAKSDTAVPASSPASGSIPAVAVEPAPAVSALAAASEAASQAGKAAAVTPKPPARPASKEVTKSAGAGPKPPSSGPATLAADATPGKPADGAAKAVANETSAGEKQAAITDPKKVCEGRWFLSYQICLNEQCAKPSFAHHPVCEERKRQEEARKANELR